MKVTVQKFQEINKILKLDVEDFAKGVAYIAALFNCEIEGVEEMARNKPRKFAKACAKIAETFARIQGEKGRAVKRFRINGSVYRVNYQPKERPHNAGRYVEVAVFGRDPIANLHKLLASISTPVKWRWFRWVPVRNLERYPHERVALDFLEADIFEAYAAYVFFCQISIGSTASFRDYLTRSKGRREEKAPTGVISRSISGGFTRQLWSPKWSG